MLPLEGKHHNMNANEIPMTILQLAAVPLLVLLNGFFVAAEFALVKIRDTQLETLVLKGHRRAKVARRIVHNLDAALSSTQLGITLASLGLGWVGKPVFASLLAPVLKHFNVDPAQADWIAFAVGFTVITFLHIVVGRTRAKIAGHPKAVSHFAVGRPALALVLPLVLPGHLGAQPRRVLAAAPLWTSTRQRSRTGPFRGRDPLAARRDAAPHQRPDAGPGHRAERLRSAAAPRARSDAAAP